MKKAYFEHFKTLNELVETIEKRPLNDVFKGKELMSKDTDKYQAKKFFHSPNYEAARDLLEKGYSDPMDEMKREILKIGKRDMATRPRSYNSMVGFQAHVPNALQGIPENMINREKRVEKAKTIHLLYGFSALGNIKPSELIKGGINFISLVNSLEKQGYRIKIDIVRCTTTAQTAIGYTCNVKEYGHRLNLLKLCFPLVHPSMLRRISFAWCETLPNLTDNMYSHGYGASLIGRLDLNHEKEREYLKKHGIIGKGQYYCNVYQAMSAKSVNDLAEKMGLL
jgi:hypothetical protein